MHPAPGPAPAEPAPNGWPWSLLRGFRGGDRDALTEVYRLHAAEVACFLRQGFRFRAGDAVHRFVGFGRASELHDALQETFRRAFEPRARSGYDGLRPYGPYLRAIARNIVLAGFRGQQARFPRVGGDAVALLEVEDTSPGPGDPEAELHAAQVQRLVAAFLEGLAADERELLRLRFTEGLSQREVAERLGVGRQVVRSREDRLRARLLEHLDRRGERGLIGVQRVVLLALAEAWLAEVLR
ncbi:RNA polymerase sigma factor [Nannocystis punicea]|uniref:Sigma-70 family RNA polymerase sigma factor n=1 Tax=Nannocystis punicea TaxID=2995304 RepID=A0ABY7H9V7_9BACT|nr:sigma-70 family RNA polymerase sigma factor [Nannocystis poenicansa]WAS95824.1 sigma-70 family RNA polymerase sigma factor [Nannocystis poenicansa]